MGSRTGSNPVPHRTCMCEPVESGQKKLFVHYTVFPATEHQAGRRERKKDTIDGRGGQERKALRMLT